MSTIGQVDSGYTSTYGTTAASSASTTSKTSSKTSSYGNTIGDVTLSDKAASYYEELKSKYSDMDFVLVSDDEVDGVEEKAAQYANSDRTLVIINVSNVEQMAEDEDYQKKYEDIISSASEQLDQMKETLGSLAGNVKTFGIKVDDNGNTSYFAVVDKSIAAQKERIEKKAAEKKEEKAKEAKAEEKEKAEEALEEKRAEAKETGDTETLSAHCIEDLMEKITDSYMETRTSQVRTEQEMQVGTQFDIRL
jgi:hypothetical protein